MLGINIDAGNRSDHEPAKGLKGCSAPFAQLDQISFKHAAE